MMLMQQELDLYLKKIGFFSHNGSRHFSVFNPANEDVASENKTLGDINAIAPEYKRMRMA